MTQYFSFFLVLYVKIKDLGFLSGFLGSRENNLLTTHTKICSQHYQATKAQCFQSLKSQGQAKRAAGRSSDCGQEEPEALELVRDKEIRLILNYSTSYLN